MRFVKRLRSYFLILLFTFVILIGGSFWNNVTVINENSIEILKIQAETAYNKDIQYRHWNAAHGGVYAKIDESTKPNPYLSDISERDIATPSGKPLTLINPAYMSRQVFDSEKSETGNFSHITSLKPIRKANAPDDWEKHALLLFEKGITQYSSLDTISGKEYFRFMKPLHVEKSCLQCHAKQGYKINDIRGGISVAVDISDAEKLRHSEINSSLFLHGGYLFLGLIGLVFAFVNINSREYKQHAIQEELEKSNDSLRIVNTQKDMLFSIIAHDLKNPIQAVRRIQELKQTDFSDHVR